MGDSALTCFGLGAILTSSVSLSWASTKPSQETQLFKSRQLSDYSSCHAGSSSAPSVPFTQGDLHTAEFKWPLSGFPSQLTITVGNYITLMMSADLNTAALGKGQSWQKTSCVFIVVIFYMFIYNIDCSIMYKSVCHHIHVCLDIKSLFLKIFWFSF